MGGSFSLFRGKKSSFSRQREKKVQSFPCYKKRRGGEREILSILRERRRRRGRNFIFEGKRGGRL
jgi:hypothetical protein